MVGTLGPGIGVGRAARFKYVATAGQTTFSGADASAQALTMNYTPGYLEVSVDGIWLTPDEYTATNGSSIVFPVGLAVGRVVYAYALSTFSAANAYDKSQNALDIGGLVPECGQLTFTSTAALAFKPYKGDLIKINGNMVRIPSGGIAGLGAPTSVFLNGVAAQTLVAATTYYIYAFVNAGVLTADFSATGHSPSATAGNVGVEIKTGDDTRTLIGMVRTGGTVIYASDLQVASWFNRRNKSSSSNGSGIASGGVIPAINFVTWAEEAFTACYAGIATNGTINANHTGQIRIDASGVGGSMGGTTPVAGGNVGSAGSFVTTATEGNHAFDVLLSVNAGTQSFTGTSSIMVRG